MNASRRSGSGYRRFLPVAFLPFPRSRPWTAPARAPSTLDGWLLHAARSLWVILAVLGVLAWMVLVPIYHRHALSFTTNDCCVTRDPATWRAGLNQLGLSPSFYAAYRVAVESVLAWSMFLIGLLIFLRKSDEWIALFVSITLVGLGMAATNETGYGGAFPHWMALILTAYISFPYYAFFLIALVFPDGRFVPRWTVVLAPVLAIKAVVDVFVPHAPPVTTWWLAVIFAVVALIVATAVLVAPIYRYRVVSDATQRKQTKWAVLGLVGAIGTFLAMSAIPELMPSVAGTPSRAVLFDLVSFALVACAFVFMSVAFGVAVLRYHLWDIDLILNRALVYLALSAAIIGLYVLIVVGVGALFQTRGSLLLSLLATALVAVLFHPLRERLQRGVNRLMYGERDEPYAVIARLSRQLERTLSPDAVLPVIVQTVAQSLKLPYAAVSLKVDGGFAIAAAAGTPVADPLILPLLYQGEEIGQLILGPRPGEAAFAPADRRLLDDLAHQAGIAAYAVRLTSDLQHSRQRLVTAREEERRRVRRDLHDGLGPALATMALQSEAARDLLASQPAQSDLLLADLTDQLQEAIADIRRLVHDLSPPALDDLGLVGALRSQIARFQRGGLAITLEAPAALPALPAAVEVAAYRIILEALNNVVRHAEAGTCRIRLWLDERAALVCLEVSDDGRGLPAERPPGTGLASMRERAAELGGSCVIEASATGGTIVRATIPIAIDVSPPPVSTPAVPS